MSLEIRAPWLEAETTRAVWAALTAEGAFVRFVGGCVRNAVINGPPTDVDLVIDQPPEQTLDLLAKAGLRAEPTGLDHGVVMAVLDGQGFEIASMRRDVTPDGRRSKVEYGASVLEDAQRRDFTINALYADRTGRVEDPIGWALSDLEARRVRFIGSPAKRIQEDYLRILRLFRFHAWYGEGEMEPPGLVACAGLAAGLERVSRERVGAEMMKLMAAPDPSIAMKAMEETGVMEYALPEARRNGPFAALSAMERRYGVQPVDPMRRLALLTRGAAPEEVMERLRLSRHAANELTARSVSYPITDSSTARRLGYERGAEAARDVMLIAAADGGPAIQARWFGDINEGARQKLPVTANDLIDVGFTPGPRLGAALTQAERDWVASDFVLDRATLVARASEVREAS
ncbi:CCA tRNA nucleotidyltransferase [Neomegalonema sp.]|uniref:CCA tRNA nucleotidyltransferase n=1 Tax=Neomegalonema sp. TaxID=2039713 RepID=UPI00260CA61B|nr:CCA tRNA nucleotidyltransferase [Neomegalonema sp.]MDD2868700.1 CCA tRNA nucleotidyltransferase [Neomegalonema sp.]